jgi:hypothetical protein
MSRRFGDCSRREGTAERTAPTEKTHAKAERLGRALPAAFWLASRRVSGVTGWSGLMPVPWRQQDGIQQINYFVYYYPRFHLPLEAGYKVQYFVILKPVAQEKPAF